MGRDRERGRERERERRERGREGERGESERKREREREGVVGVCLLRPSGRCLLAEWEHGTIYKNLQEFIIIYNNLQ